MMSFEDKKEVLNDIDDIMMAFMKTNYLKLM